MCRGGIVVLIVGKCCVDGGEVGGDCFDGFGRDVVSVKVEGGVGGASLHPLMKWWICPPISVVIGERVNGGKSVMGISDYCDTCSDRGRE